MKGRNFFWFGLGIFLILIIVAIYGHYFMGAYDEIDLLNMSAPPSVTHWLGTDELGRDILTNLLYGLGVSLFVGLTATVSQLIIGLSAGLLAGFFGGWLDYLIMRLADIVLCLPMFILASAITAIIGPNIRNLIIIIALLSWADVSRIVRAQVIQERNQEYILSAKLANWTSLEIIRFHFIPHLIPQLVVASTISMANAILMEASLSFLGLGVKMPMPSLGNMLNNAQNLRSLQYEWWTWLPAGIMIVLLVFSINLMGEGLRIKGGQS